MSELIDNSGFRKSKLKELILKLHQGEDADKVKEELRNSLQNIPYGEVVEVEQELIEDGLPSEEVLKLCDVHGEVLDGSIDLSGAKEVPEGHPVDILMKENREVLKVCNRIHEVITQVGQEGKATFANQLLELRGLFNNLMDLDKHYQRKEYLIFPYLEDKGITGPPKVMWGKQDEIREQIKGCIELCATPELEANDLVDASDLLLIPALKGISEMVKKEEEILFPMCLDNLSDADWWQIQKQTPEIGFCLYDPQVTWKPDEIAPDEATQVMDAAGNIQMPSGSFNAEELLAILNTLPVDMTFVDRNDKVKYFSQSAERIFTRSRAIINRDVRYCHPPASAHIVDKIVDDFKSGRQSHAPFWIQMKGKFILIQYYALRNEAGEYLGTLEVSQDLTNLRQLEGEQRILSYK